MNDLSAGAVLIDLISRQAPWIALAVARPFGMTLIFYAFAWGHLNSGILRMAFAFAIAAPSVGSGVPLEPVESLETAFTVLLVKELFLGLVLGLICSVPLAVATAAGGIIDIYRGAMAGGPDPAGGEMASSSTVLVVLSLWLFAAAGGFFLIAQVIYASYTIWPATAPVPSFTGDLSVLYRLGAGIIKSALVLSGPLVAVMFFSDVAHLISAKFGKQINVSQLAFTSKNIIFVALLPIYLLFAFQVLGGAQKETMTGLRLMEGLFR